MGSCGVHSHRIVWVHGQEVLVLWGLCQALGGLAAVRVSRRKAVDLPRYESSVELDIVVMLLAVEDMGKSLTNDI